MEQQQLFDSIFKTNKEDGLRSIEAAVSKYPYYIPAHFFQLLKSKKEDYDYDKLAEKTALFFQNPFFLNFRLHENERKGAYQPVEEQGTDQFREKEPKEELLFEPLYATDYFASQGIKLSEEVKEDDKLGKQLRSFTDWLKTMKKVPGGQLPSGNEQADLAVQQLAESSNREGKVITESMAEVFISQGKNAKAREIYEKLSLLNPSKSAYFAAKIESLNDK